MYLVRFSGDTGSGVNCETKLFINEDAAKAYMVQAFEKVRDLCAKNGAALPTESSEDNDEYYTDISELDIYVYMAGETMHWEVVEIVPQDLPASLEKHLSEDIPEHYAVTAHWAESDDNISITLADPNLQVDEDELIESQAEKLGLDDPGDMYRDQYDGIWLPETVVGLIEVNAIRKFLAGKFSITPIGYTIAQHANIGLEIETITDAGVFEDDAAAVEQAIKDGVKLIPVEELPSGLDKDLCYLGWVDTPENREAIQNYCDKKRRNQK